MGVLIKISNMLKDFSTREREVAKYILEKTEKVKSLNTYEVAKKTKTSQATVVRFAKRLGFKGFPDFKIALSQDIGNRKAEESINIIHEEIGAEDSFEIIGKKIANANMVAIKNTCDITDFEELEKAVNAIEKADRIMIAGLGFSGIMARDLSFKLIELGKSVIIENDNHMQLSYLSTLNEKDLLFVISHSGKTAEIYNIVKVAKDKKIPIIAMTSIAPNPIRELADIKISTVEMKNNFRSTALSPRISQLTLIDMLYVKLMLENKDMQDYIFDAIELVQGFKLK